MAWPRNIYSFPATPTPGAYPASSSDLAADAAGNLYGYLTGGGPRNEGTIFRLTPPAAKGQTWTEQTLYTFAYAVSGSLPEGKPLLDAAGNIYGVSQEGGAYGQIEDGTVWKLSPPVATGGQWTLQVLLNFNNPGNLGPGGGSPWSGLVMDRSGTLYGTTVHGGSYVDGVVFSLAPPSAGGTTWTETVLHNFGSKNDGGYVVLDPLTLADHENALFGVAGESVNAKGVMQAGGLVYRLRRNGSAWTYAIVHRFDYEHDQADGYFPTGSLVVDRDNNLFGTTIAGGASSFGTVFELSPPASGQTAWTEQVLHRFTGPDGEFPQAGLVAGGLPTALFGTTLEGGQGGAVDGSSGSDGVVFRLDPPTSGSGPWTYTALHAFDAGPSSGRYKYTGQAGYLLNGLTFGRHRLLFGTTGFGGLNDGGVVFVLPPR